MSANNTYLPPSPVIPQALNITNITQAILAVVTVDEENSYVVGQLIHLTVPQAYGMYQADQLNGQILGIDGLNFITSIDTSQFTPFVTPGEFQQKPASLSPAGSRNLYNISTVPFHSLGNFGN